MGRQEILALLEGDLKSVETSIHLNYQSDVAMIPLVSDYLTNGGGKRLRPMLVLLSSRLCGYEGGDRAIVHSTVVEYIHAATLLHDDVVDDSDQRRGLASANAKFGNSMAVLVGDYLFAKSFSLMAAASSPEIIHSVSEATRYLAEGEVLQLVHNGDLEITEQKYLDVIFRKTAALITACCQIGGYLGKATPERRRALESFGKKIGIAFQIVDDLLDFVADEKTLGKPVGQDIAEGHITLPVIHAYQMASPEDKEFLRKTVKDETLTRQRMGDVIALVTRYDGLGYSSRMAEKYAKDAIHELEAFAPGLYVDALSGLAEYIIHRKY
jgi:octaprenyl-diphosphate synthase